MQRSVLRQRDRFQLNYELSHEASRSHVYPRQSSNGSTVIVYGHDQGLRLVWYAGRPFKRARTDTAPTAKLNGNVKSDPMVIDIDDDDDEDESTTRQTQSPPADFEKDEEEVDPSAPYRDVLRYVDIPLGTSTSSIAVPHIAQDLAQAAPEAWPAIFAQRIVVAIACTDLTIRIVSAPLDPPSPEVHELAKMDIQTLKLFGPSSHQEFISDIAITHTAGVNEDVEEQVESGTQTRSQTKQESTASEAPKWSLLVASISCTGSGLLLVHQLPLTNSQVVATPEHFLPIRRQYLTSSSMGAKLAFNPSPYPAERHSSLLITLPAASCAKLFQVFPTYTRERRGSGATADSVSSTRSSRVSGNDRGKFLFTFLPSFSQDSAELTQQRKKVLDAKWIAGGRAVIALLEDGEWGIWDLEAVGPTSSSSGGNLIRGQGNLSGIQGGSMTRFSIRSSIMPPVEARPKSSNPQHQPTSGSLAPMTPSTRKTRSEGLFLGSKPTDTPALSGVQRSGIIQVVAHPANRLVHDESVILNFAQETIHVPSILSFWKGESKPVRLPASRLGGQALRSISILPDSNPPATSMFDASVFNTTSSHPDLLIQTSHRLIFSVNPLSSLPSTADAESQTFPPGVDQKLLASGELDVDGMDRILDDMGGGGAPVASSKPMNLFSKSVGFQLDDDADEDIDMGGSPTPSKRKGLRPGTGRLGPGFEVPAPQRRIFS